jgi:hypothetical protein
MISSYHNREHKGLGIGTVYQNREDEKNASAFFEDRRSACAFLLYLEVLTNFFELRRREHREIHE